MKKALALATLMTASFAQAQSSNNDLSFGDLNYFLRDGQFNLSADANIVRREFQQQFTAAKVNTEFEGYLFQGRLGYGLADNLNAFVGLGYIYEGEITAEPRTPGTRYDQSGLTNPVVGLNYRVMDQRKGGLNWDLGAVAALSIQDEERSSFGQGDANAATGNHAVELNTSVGSKWNEANEWRLTAGVQYNMAGEYTIDQAAGETDGETESALDIFARAAYQYRPVNEFMMALSVQGTRVGTREYEEQTGPITNELESDSRIDFDMTFTAKYLITENLIGRFNYGQSRLADYEVSSNQAGGDHDVNRRRGQFFGLGVDLLF